MRLRESACKWGEGQGGGESPADSPLSEEPHTGSIPQPRDHDLSRSQESDAGLTEPVWHPASLSVSDPLRCIRITFLLIKLDTRGAGAVACGALRRTSGLRGHHHGSVQRGCQEGRSPECLTETKASPTPSRTDTLKSRRGAGSRRPRWAFPGPCRWRRPPRHVCVHARRTLTHGAGGPTLLCPPHVPAIPSLFLFLCCCF